MLVQTFIHWFESVYKLPLRFCCTNSKYNYPTLLGVAYRMDAKRGNCTVTTIAGGDFDAHSLDDTTVRIRTAKEFFYFDKTQYAYEGVVS